MPVLFPDAIARPTRDTPAVNAKALDMIADELAKWCEARGEADVDRDEVRAQIAEAIEHCFGSDGYEIAKELEDRGWMPNAELVKICDDWSSIECGAELKAVEAWVKEIDLKPAHAVGTRVKAQWGSKNKLIEGEIVRIDERYGHYTVRREGDGPGCGAVVNYENVLEVL